MKIVPLVSTMLKETAGQFKGSVLTEFIVLKFYSMFHPPRSKTTRRRTYKTCSHIVLVQMKTIMNGVKIGQCHNENPQIRINLIFITNTLIRRTIVFTVLRMWFLGHRMKIAYDWLWVWVDANHPSFQNCIIDRSNNVCDEMNHVMEKIIEEAITTTDPYIIGISSGLDAKYKEGSEGMCNIDHEAACPYTIHTVVLSKPPLIDANVNSAITAMLDIVQPKNDDVNEDATYDDVLPHEKYALN
jgi:hypothetical protein